MATSAELRKQVQAMIDSGKSEEEIGKFISNATSPHEPAPKPKDYTGPTTFWGGVGNSLMSGEALGTGLRGGGGFLKGATVDIPESIAGGINAAIHPIDTIMGIPAGMRNAANTFSKAGSNPEAFGEMMGQVTGQPLVTAGLTKALPPTLRGVGGLMEKYQPITGMIPGMLHMRTLRNIERIVGSGMGSAGEFLQPYVDKLGSFSESKATTPPTQSPFRTNTGGPLGGIEPSPEIYHPDTPTSTMRGFREVEQPVKTPSASGTGTKVPTPTNEAQMLNRPNTTTSQTMTVQPKYNFKVVRGADGNFYTVPGEPTPVGGGKITVGSLETETPKVELPKVEPPKVEPPKVEPTLKEQGQQAFKQGQAKAKAAWEAKNGRIDVMKMLMDELTKKK